MRTKKRPSRIPLTAQQVLDNMLESVVITDIAGTIQAVNPTFTEITGHLEKDVIGKNPKILQSGRHKAPFYKKMWNALNRNGIWQGEIWNKKKNGELYQEWLTITAIRNRSGKTTHYMAVFTDITKKKRAEETIRHMAYYDSLTDLPNRALFMDRLKQAIIHAQRHEGLLGVLFLDLDRVKIINDTLGHDKGDELFKHVANRLRSALRETDTIARLGGDEFMILLPGIERVENTNRVAEKILESLKPAFTIDKQEIYVTGSVGISVYPFDGTDADTLLKNADTAMYRAKRRGRNNYQAFTPAMNVEVFTQLSLGNSLRRALERKEFVIYYQPQLSLKTGQIVGMEALVRWQHPDLGLVPPSHFIHWAEDSGLIVPLGEMVLQLACQQNKAWHDAGHGDLTVSVNLSARQFKQRDLVDFVSETLRKTGLPASALELELTESVVMETTEPAATVPHELKAMGVGFSIDDFGTGYSSLSYLKRFPANTLKIDQSFVQDIGKSDHDAAIATAVIALGHGMNLSVVAEGVETESQLDCLRRLKCDKIQGFLFSEPVAPDEFEKLLREKRRLPASLAGVN